jgi:hypothetical protein
MIVLDEELQGLGLEATIGQWYRGAVILIKHLRPGTVIKDEAVPVLLRRVKFATFVTINYGDFWRHLPAEQSFCVLCLKLTVDQVGEISHWLRQVFRLPEFKTKTARMGKVALVSPRSLQYYHGGDSLVYLHVWSAAERHKQRS